MSNIVFNAQATQTGLAKHYIVTDEQARKLKKNSQNNRTSERLTHIVRLHSCDFLKKLLCNHYGINL